MRAAAAHVEVGPCPFTIFGPGLSMLSLDDFRLGCRGKSVSTGVEKPAR